MAGDEVGRINVMDGEANNRMGVYTSAVIMLIRTHPRLV